MKFLLPPDLIVDSMFQITDFESPRLTYVLTTVNTDCELILTLLFTYLVELSNFKLLLISSLKMKYEKGNNISLTDYL